MEFDTAIIIPIIVGIVEMLKQAGIPAKYSPIIALVLGIGGVILLSGLSIESGLQGLVYGLSASGLYSGGKALIKK